SETEVSVAVPNEVIRDAPLSGVKVVELSSWLMTPTAGALLAAHGADVVKIERANAADPMRGLNLEPGAINSGYEIANNRKRAMQLNLAAPEAREIMHRLLSGADNFLTNVRSAS